MAPDDIPRGLPREHTAILPEALGRLARDFLAYNNVLGVLGRYSLATMTPNALGLHRLVQAVIRARLELEEERQWVKAAIDLLHASFPPKSWVMESWPVCQQLLPHSLSAVGHAERIDMASENVGWLLVKAAWYLWARAQYREARPLAERALEIGQATLGPDHREMATWHSNLGLMLRRMGDLDGARTEFERALEIGQATVGPDHPNVADLRRDLDDVMQQPGGV